MSQDYQFGRCGQGETRKYQFKLKEKKKIIYILYIYI